MASYENQDGANRDEIKSLAIKKCRKCLVDKHLDLFVNNHVFKDGKDTICLDCSREKVKLWRKVNPDKRKLQLKKESKKDYNHNKHLKATYGITFNDYRKMFDEQHGCCKICGRHQVEFQKRLSVDHNHVTGKVRALLCHNCNSILGDAREKIDVLEKAINYLKDYNGL